MSEPLAKTFFVRDYNLSATLKSGQAFRWREEQGRWTGIIGSRWVRLQGDATSITAETAQAVPDWNWLIDYLQLELDLDGVLKTFPSDGPMRAAVASCGGLRLLRQDPWECLASFILSSTKQIVQIQQVISSLCATFGEPVRVPPGHASACAFPSAARLAQATDSQLRACKMGFRAPYLHETARRIADGKLDLARLGLLPVAEARAALVQLPGVGRKIADCVLLFAYGCQTAFPVDVWVSKALRALYFRGKRINVQRLHRFAANHFGPNAGYAQQYLFHYARTNAPETVFLKRAKAQ